MILFVGQLTPFLSLPYVNEYVGHQSVYKERCKDTVINCIDTEKFVWNMAT